MIPMGKHRNSSYSGLAVPPVCKAIRDAGLEPSEIDAVYCGHAFGGMLTGQRIVKEVGIGGVPIFNVDNACSGGATALHLAWKRVCSGEQTGRASCREKVCQYVETAVVAVSLKKKTINLMNNH